MSNKEVMQQALLVLESGLLVQRGSQVLNDLRAALAKPEPVAHRHEWIRTGAMKPNEMRCLQCGAWGEKE